MIDDLQQLRATLISAKNAGERLSILDEEPSVQAFSRQFEPHIDNLSPENQCILKQLIVLKQLIEPNIPSYQQLAQLLSALEPIDHFYREIGGIIGYQVEVLKQLSSTQPKEEIIFHPPQCDDISEETREVREATITGLESMPILAEFYPLGGAADRLHLVDIETGQELPAAKLRFAGCTLLETLVRDLQAREWLYYRLFGRQITTPIAIMTSREKDNERHVLKVCEDQNFFGRPKDLFRFFVQPLVPTVDAEGNWHTSAPLKPVLKPGGHGAIWKLSCDEGIFDWLKSLGSKKAIIRQINNPIAGLDYGLLAFFGIGCKRDMAFGFASCNRLVKSAEGMVVLIEKKSGHIVLTNIEYCDFAKFGIEDEPISSDRPFSRFGSNTNILFADLNAIEKAVQSHPFPGLLVNLKPTVIAEKEVMLGRLESTMQNIADAFAEPKIDLRPSKTFVVHNVRHKTISVAKKAYHPGKSLLETPEFCFYELLLANRELLNKCGFSLSPLSTPEEYLKQGPNALFLYHSSLGPLYSIIQQKLRGGFLAPFSELSLFIGELSLSNLTLDGSLQIRAEQPFGHLNERGILQYSDRVGRCSLHNVTVQNRGVDWAESAPYWKMDLLRRETVEIILKGCSEFDAQDTALKGAHRFVVEDGMRMIVREIDGQLIVKKEPVPEKPLWTYTRTEQDIRLIPRTEPGKKGMN